MATSPATAGVLQNSRVGCRVLGAGVHTSTHGQTCYFGMLVHTNMLRAGMLVCLCCWGAPQHCSMPTTWVLACWGACQQHRQTILSLLPRWLAINQHASMSRLGGAGMLGCMPAAQTDQHSWSPPSLAGLAIDQHERMPTTGVLACWGAPQHASILVVAGMLACWSIASQRGPRTKNAVMSVLFVSSCQ